MVGGARRTPPPGKKGRMEWMGHEEEGERTRHVEESEGTRQRRRVEARLSSTTLAWSVESSIVSLLIPCMRHSSVLGYTVLDMGRHRSTHSHTLPCACLRFGDVQRNRTCVLVDAPNYCLVHPIGFQLLSLRSHSFVVSFPLCALVTVDWTSTIASVPSTCAHGWSTTCVDSLFVYPSSIDDPNRQVHVIPPTCLDPGGWETPLRPSSIRSPSSSERFYS